MTVAAEATVLNEYSGLGISDVNALGSTVLHDCLTTELRQRGLWDDPEVRWSYLFAMDLHQDEQRADGPYVDHLARVGLWVIRDFDVSDAEAAKAALLHDVVENHPKDIIKKLGADATHGGTIYDRAQSVLANSGKLGRSRTNAAIDALTCPSFAGLEPAEKRRRYARHIVQVTLQDPLAAAVKIADRLDNANGNKFNPDSKMQRRLDKKYYPLHDVFVNAVHAEDSLIPDHRKQGVTAKLDQGHEEARARLLTSFPGVAGMSENEVAELALGNVLDQKGVA